MDGGAGKLASIPYLSHIASKNDSGINPSHCGLDTDPLPEEYLSTKAFGQIPCILLLVDFVLKSTNGVGTTRAIMLRQKPCSP